MKINFSDKEIMKNKQKWYEVGKPWGNITIKSTSSKIVSYFGSVWDKEHFKKHIKTTKKMY